MSIPKEISKSNRNKEDPEKILDSIRVYIKNGFDSEKYSSPLIHPIITINNRKQGFSEKTIRFKTTMLDIDVLEKKLNAAKISFQKSRDEILIGNHIRIGDNTLNIGVDILTLYPGLTEIISESLIDSENLKSYLSILAQERAAKLLENKKPGDDELFESKSDST